MSLRIKILYFHHAIGLGGAPKSLSILIQSLDKTRYEPIVVMPKRKGNGEVKQLFLDAGAEVIEETHIRPFHGVNGSRCDSFYQRTHTILAVIPTVIASYKQVRKLKPHIVHINTCVLPFAALGTRLARLNIPIITHVRESVLKNWWGRLLSFFNRKFSHWYIGIDQSGLDSIGIAADRCAVIHNSIDTKNIIVHNSAVEALRDKFNCTDDTVVFASICRITPANGTLKFAQFLADKKADLPSNVRFVFCGFDKTNSEYGSKAQDAIDQYEHSFAMDFTKEIGDLITACDVILAPFTTSHSARVVIEGATLGKPALVTDLPNLREQISLNESGLIFNYEEPETIIQATQHLSDRKQSITMGKAAKKFADQNFSLGKNIAKVLNFYAKILKAPTSSSSHPSDT